MPCSNRKRGLARKKTQEQFEQDLQIINPTIKVLGEYKGVSNRVLVKCSHCGYEWMAMGGTLLRGGRCPKCVVSGTSFMEMAIYYAFCLVLGNDAVKSRNKSAIGKELDVFIPDLNFAVEPGGWYWHKRKVENDLQKQVLCHEKGIRCITIYDNFTDNTAPFDDCWCYHEDFSDQHNESVLRDVIDRLFSVANIRQEISDDDWGQVKQQAYLSTCQMTTDELKEKVAAIRPDIEILGEFTGMHHYIKAKCRTCGHVWNATPVTMFQGRGCRKCGRKIVAKKLTLSQEEFEDKLYTVNPDIEVLGVYRGYEKHIAVRCLRCGNEWMPPSASILSAGSNCPVCSIRRRTESNRKSHDEFMRDFAKKGHPNVEILGEYHGSHAPIRVRCKKCGREWDSIPNTLLLGHGCRVCAGNAKKSNEQFLQELKVAHPELEAMTPYAGAREKVKVHCNACGCDFESCAARLIRINGTGCQNCRKKKNSPFMTRVKKTAPPAEDR